VRSYGAPFDRFRIRLPRGADLLPAAQSGMTMTTTAPEAGHPNFSIVEVKLEKKSVGPVDVRLLAEKQRNAAEDDQPAELSGFDVVGAVRQRGSIAVQVVGNWQVTWGESENVRQVDEAPEELRRENLAATFDYFVQPYSLSARIVPQRTRLTVDPEYVVLVGPNRAQLQAKLRYMVRGAKLRNLEISLPGWVVDRIGPSNLIDPEAPVDTSDGRLTIVLQQPTSGEVEISLEAHRELQSTDTELAIELPAPRAESIAPAVVAIVPADDVE
jgi:hypothetical protein